MKKVWILLIVTVLFITAFSTTVTLQLKWFYQFQFAGFLVAKEKGFYKEEGLDVVIKQGGPLVSPTREVLTGKAEFGIAGPDVIQLKAAKKPVKALMVVFQQSPTCIISLKDSGIKEPKDFKGKIIGVLNDYTWIELQLLLAKAGLTKRDIKTKRWTFNMEAFYKGEYDAVPVYITNEPDLAKAAGYEVNIIKPYDYGIRFVGDVLFVSENYLKEHPDIVKKFIKASYKGWLYAIQHPEEAIKIILEKYNTQKLTKEHLEYEAKKTIELVTYGLESVRKFGTFNYKQWETMAKLMKEYKLARTLIDINDLIYDEIINEIAK